jgi:hypothetical protein
MGIASGGKWMPVPKVLALNADKSACGEEPPPYNYLQKARR